MYGDEEELTPAQRRLRATNRGNPYYGTPFSPEAISGVLEPDVGEIGGEMDFSQEDMTEEQRAQLIELGVLDSELEENARQRKIAEELRHRAGPEGRQAGRVYVAANPLEHLSAGIDKVMAAREMKKLDKARGGILEKQKSGRGTIADLIRGKTARLKMPKLSLDDEEE